MTQKIKGKVLSADGSIQAPTMDTINSLAAKLQSATTEKSQHLQLAATYQANFDSRKDCGGFKQACNNWLDKRNAENAAASALDSTISSLNKQLADAKTDYNNAVTAYSTQQTALASTNPEIVKAQAALAATQLESSANTKKYIIIGVIVFIIALSVVLMIWFVKRKVTKIK